MVGECGGGGGVENKTNSRGTGERENKAEMKDEGCFSHKRPSADCVFM